MSRSDADVAGNPIKDRHRVREYYDALVRRDPAYLGTFYAAVATTGIFCLPTCRARKPKEENVTFYTSMGDALRDGYRPCKVCRPTEEAGSAPPDVREALRLVERSSDHRITDADLRAHNVSPSAVRRWCKEHLGLTFHGYQRMIRVNSAYRALNGGSSVTSAAFDSGYASLSGFSHSFRSIMKRSPSAAVSQTVMHLERFPTPLGPMFAGATENGLCLLEFTDRRMLEREIDDLTRRLGATIIRGGNQYTRDAQAQLAEYFSGTRTEFTVPLEMPGSDFRRSVWEELRRIPYGEVRSYRDQACALGKPEAVRAVAAANGHNRISIIVPCHRVIGADGKLVGYGGGLPRKRRLLELEARHKPG